MDHYTDLRSAMVRALIDVGLTVEMQHHEVGTAGQAEIDILFGPLLQQADNLAIRRPVHGRAARHAVGENMGDARGEDARLARAGAGEHQQRAFGGQHRLALLLVETLEEVRITPAELAGDRVGSAGSRDGGALGSAGMEAHESRFVPGRPDIGPWGVQYHAQAR